QPVEQRALADVGPPDDGDEARLVRQGVFSLRTISTCCSVVCALPARAICGTSSKPFTTSPKMVCLLLRCGVGTSVMKNCEPLVFGPAFAIARSPGLSNLRPLWNSFLKR